MTEWLLLPAAIVGIAGGYWLRWRNVREDSPMDGVTVSQIRRKNRTVSIDVALADVVKVTTKSGARVTIDRVDRPVQLKVETTVYQEAPPQAERRV